MYKVCCFIIHLNGYSLFFTYIFKNRTYYVQNIPHSNLILLVLLKTCHCFEKSVRFEPRDIDDLTEDESCKTFRAEQFRKGPDVCYKEHEQVCLKCLAFFKLNTDSEFFFCLL